MFKVAHRLLLAVVTCLIIQSYRLWSVAPIVKIPAAQIDSVWIGVIILFGLVFLFLHLLVDTLLAERQGQERLAAANDRLRQYALRIEELATVQERNRIARDIHDSLGHSLTVVNIHIAAALRLLHVDLPETETLLVEAKQLGAQALQDVRQSVSLLRADPLQGRSLPEAIDSLVLDFQRSTGIKPTCHLEIDRPLSPELKFTIYGRDAIDLVATLQPDVVLMDIRMPILDGVEAARIICPQYPTTKVLILTTFDDREYVTQALHAGAAGYLLKDTPFEELTQAIRLVEKGYTQLGPGLASKVLAQPNPHSNLVVSDTWHELTPKEQEIVNAIATGASNREIAEALFIAEKTVKNRITSILSKLNLRDRTQLAIVALQKGTDES